MQKILLGVAAQHQERNMSILSNDGVPASKLAKSVGVSKGVISRLRRQFKGANDHTLYLVDKTSHVKLGVFIGKGDFTTVAKMAALHMRLSQTLQLPDWRITDAEGKNEAKLIDLMKQ